MCVNVSCACPALPCERPSTGHAVRLVFDVLFAAASRVLSRTRLHTSFVCGCVLRVPSVDQPPRLPFVTGCTRTFVAVEWGWRRPRDLQLPLQCVWRCRRRRMACSGWCSSCGAVCPRELVVVVPRSSATNMVDIRPNVLSPRTRRWTNRNHPRAFCPRLCLAPPFLGLPAPPLPPRAPPAPAAPAAREPPAAPAAAPAPERVRATAAAALLVAPGLAV